MAMATKQSQLVVVAVDSSEQSMNALKWALNLKNHHGTLVILHVQSPPSIWDRINPAKIPFGGPNYIVVPALTLAIEAHRKRISSAIISHALKICSETKMKIQVIVIEGKREKVICQVAKEMKAHLLVIGASHSYCTIKRLHDSMTYNKDGDVHFACSRN